jgi:hypothetical protein
MSEESNRSRRPRRWSISHEWLAVAIGFAMIVLIYVKVLEQIRW